MCQSVAVGVRVALTGIGVQDSAVAPALRKCSCTAACARRAHPCRARTQGPLVHAPVLLQFRHRSSRRQCKSTKGSFPPRPAPTPTRLSWQRIERPLAKDTALPPESEQSYVPATVNPVNGLFKSSVVLTFVLESYQPHCAPQADEVALWRSLLQALETPISSRDCPSPAPSEPGPLSAVR